MSTTPEARLSYLGFQRIPPGPLLRSYVSTFWYFRRKAPLLDYHEEFMHPRGGFGIAFNFGDKLQLDSQPLTEPVFLDGSNTISRKMGFLGSIDLMGVSFWAGSAFPFLTVPLVELRNEVALLDVLDRASLMQLYGRLYEANDLSMRIHLLEQWLIDRLSLGKERHPIVPASLALLRETQGRVAIPALAQNLLISQRQLERLYQSQVGMSPKQYARLLRVETARLALRQSPIESTANLAIELGFYDQAHFIHEFSEVIGMTPHRYVARSRRPMPTGR
jgi:AraC-like DNA-binding protein